MKALRDQRSHQAFYQDEHLFVDLRHELAILGLLDPYPDSDGVPPIGAIGLVHCSSDSLGADLELCA